nr:hypothetical protein [Priestia aryabhattai]MDH3135569.1 hypothetical protein [Priestia aryabhattai]
MKKRNFRIDFTEAEKNARKRDFEKDSGNRLKAEELKKSLLDQLKELTGEDHFDLDLLNRIGYLTQAEESFCLKFRLI